MQRRTDVVKWRTETDRTASPSANKDNFCEKFLDIHAIFSLY